MEFPSLIILCGVPAVGKSTYAKAFLKAHPEAVHLTSDGIRRELYGAEAILGDRKVVFSLMIERAKQHLSEGRTVLYDSTALTRSDRRKILSQCPGYVRTECHVLWAPREVCICRDAARDRTVGPEVIDLLTGKFEAPFYDEGLLDIRFSFPDDFDPLAYEREKQLPPADMTIEDPDVRFASRCLAAGIGPWESIGLPGASPAAVWMLSAAYAEDTGKYRRQLPPFLKKELQKLT
ncbi:MAG: ATP-binding protein [Oscillospiraceae bacterium]|nr:ATP-binding protein [Oscillospiraceae bacterium]